MFVRMFAPGISFRNHITNPYLTQSRTTLHVQKKGLIELTEETFKTVFKDSPLKEPSLRALEGNVDLK
jgi:hypothetical protein